MEIKPGSKGPFRGRETRKRSNTQGLQGGMDEVEKQVKRKQLWKGFVHREYSKEAQRYRRLLSRGNGFMRGRQILTGGEGLLRLAGLSLGRVNKEKHGDVGTHTERGKDSCRKILRWLYDTGI